MAESIHVHSSLVVNAIGHCAGALAFGLLLYLIFLSRHRTYRAEHLLTAAAALAFTWNAGSLLALTLSDFRSPLIDLLVSISFSALSFLPAVLLHIAVSGERRRPFLIIGYSVSTVSTLLHMVEMVRPDSRFHYAGLLLITAGFGGLAVLTLLVDRSRPGGRLATSLCLFLLAVSFVHFGSGNARQAWSSEVALHHAGIPLAMIILLRDYRFLLMDAFLRLAVDGALAVGTAWTLFKVAASTAPLSPRTHPGVSVMVLIGASLGLALFIWLRGRLQQLLTKFVFVQPDVPLLESRLCTALRGPGGDVNLEAAGELVAQAFACTEWAWSSSAPPSLENAIRPSPVSNQPWVEAVVPVRIPGAEPHYLLLGPRRSRRRYLSQDFETLAALAVVLVDEIGRLRAAEAQRLVTQAELRALQAQINPHFLFNALNTIYGMIDRGNSVARRLVLHLADLLRFFFRPEQMMIPLSEEIRIVRAYLDVEQARLGAKLIVNLQVDPETYSVQVPALCVQPLVENAIKHGAASRSKGGTVSIAIQGGPVAVRVEVSNSGAFVEPKAGRIGVGLANVRRRLQLWYGPECNVTVASDAEWTQVSFSIPIAATAHAISLPS